MAELLDRDETRPARFTAPAGWRALLICPDDGMKCVGVDVADGRGQALFAARRPDGQYPSSEGWLPRALGGGPGTAGIDDSGWRVCYAGIVPTCVTGTVYPKGAEIGVWIGGPAELAVFWLQDSAPDALINLDPALFIPGLVPAIAPVSTGPDVWRVPAIITTAEDEQGNTATPASVAITGNPATGQTGIVRNGVVVNVGTVDIALELSLGDLLSRRR